MSWNPVLNKFIEIKWAFMRAFSRDELYDYDRSEQTCLDYWVEKLDNVKRQNISDKKLSDDDVALLEEFMEFLHKKG